MGKKKPGRPLLTGKKMKKYLVTLDSDSVKRGKQLGQGNLSAGIRSALAKKRG